MSSFLFLDFDGVLNNSSTDVEFKDNDDSGCIGFDPANVEAMNLFLSRNPIEIVISSTWRRGRSVRRMEEILAGSGIRQSRVHSVTPAKFGVVDRSLEIDWWMEKHESQVDSFLIVDDNYLSRYSPDRDAYADYFLLTDNDTGFTSELVTVAEEMLKRQDTQRVEAYVSNRIKTLNGGE